MERKNDTDFAQILIEMGFKGLLLRDLLGYITDEDTLFAFYNFVQKIDEEEGIMTKPLLVYKFIEHMQDKRSFQTYEQFEEAYVNAYSTSEKRIAIARLLSSKTSTSQLNKLLSILERNNVPVSMFYALIVKYRKMYSTAEIITLLETLPIS